MPGKLAPCGGKPLLAWTADAARGARSIDRVLLSTDSEQIAEIGRTHGLEVPFLRPAHLAGPDSEMIPVMQHALDWFENDQGETVEAFVLLQPTSPLRTARHIDEAVALLRSTRAETVVSVTRVPHIYWPFALHRLSPDCLVHPYVDQTKAVDDAEPAYARNGPAILANRPSVVRRGQKFGHPMAGYEMPAAASVDIDEPFDLELADFLLSRRDTTKAAAEAIPYLFCCRSSTHHRIATSVKPACARRERRRPTAEVRTFRFTSVISSKSAH